MQNRPEKRVPQRKCVGCGEMIGKKRRCKSSARQGRLLFRRPHRKEIRTRRVYLQ